MFIDNVTIYVRAGSGGKGCQSFYTSRHKRHKVPNGGDGGNGADVIIKADRNLHTLLDFQFNRHFNGNRGGSASSNNKKGRNEKPLIIRAPCGTIIKDAKTGCILRDLDKDQDEIIVARGGKGGFGNQNHRQATDGQAGEEKELQLDLKIIADVGVVGFPNAGKSTLIASISNAHPKIAAYPFTTKSPILGVVNLINEDKQFVIADIPGLIEGSSQGKGLGDRFLKHLERTNILIHLIDMAGYDGRNPVEDYRIIDKELKCYSKEIYKKPRIIAANKMDIENAGSNLELFKKTFKKKIYPISALTKEGLEELIEAIRKKL